jgi:enoyl-[acyl-carrier protein] reductase III
MKQFEGKTALITGSGRGIGSAIAIHFAELGADIIVNYVHNKQPADKTAEEISMIGRKVLVVRANIGNLEGLEKLFSEAESEFGKLDFFISNAASGFNRPAMEQKESGWEYTLNVNTKAFLFGAQLAAPLMDKAGGGKMIAITSPGADRVLPDYVAVGASKAALNSLVRYLAVELSPRNITVNGIAPGIVETGALEHFAFMEDKSVLSRAITNTPAGRLVTPMDVAEVAAFLCSPSADMIRGQIIVVDGGYTLPVPG